MLPSLLLFDPKAVSDFSILANELINLEFQQVRDPQSGIDPHNKQQ
jgi:hypothetical protein